MILNQRAASMSNDFLDSISNISEYQLEYSILTDFYNQFPDKVFLVEIDKLKSIKSSFMDISSFITDQYRSFNLQLYSYKNSIITSTILSPISGSSFKEPDLYNLAIKISRSNSSFVLLKSQSLVLYYKGEIDTKFDNKFADKLKLIEAEKDRLNIDQLSLAFEYYHSHRKYCGCSFIKSKKVKDDVTEQYLRNDLIQYLRKKMKPHLTSELCTSLTNDEESVDIGVVDVDNRVAIIEVKYFVQKGFFENPEKEAYSPHRFLDGYGQLDKYCVHLEEDKFELHSAYLYMFYAHSKKYEKILEYAKRYFDEFYDSSSYQFKQNFKCTICDNMIDTYIT